RHQHHLRHQLRRQHRVRAPILTRYRPRDLAGMPAGEEDAAEKRDVSDDVDRSGRERAVGEGEGAAHTGYDRYRGEMDLQDTVAVAMVTLSAARGKSPGTVTGSALPHSTHLTDGGELCHSAARRTSGRRFPAHETGPSEPGRPATRPTASTEHAERRQRPWPRCRFGRRLDPAEPCK